MKIKIFLFAASAFAQCLTNDFSCLGEARGNVTALNEDLCRQMKGMPGCSLRESCTTNSGTCSENVIYASICQEMPRMKGCEAFKNCADLPKCNILPSSEETTKAIYGICSEMNMVGCDVCPITSTSTYAECDLLGTYSLLCKSMPGMAQCSQFTSMCKNSTDLPFCSMEDDGHNHAVPTMKMFFHTGITDYILFEKAVPRTGGQYALAWIVVFLSAVFYEFLQVITNFMEIIWVSKQKTIESEPFDAAFGKEPNAETISDKQYSALSHFCGFSNGPQGVSIAAIRALMRIITTTLGYGLMLVAMTFNVGLFVAIIAGFGVGTFIFVPMLKIKAATLMTKVALTTAPECH